MKKGKKGLLIALIAANVFVLLLGILTITPALRGLAERIDMLGAGKPAPPALTEEEVEGEPWEDPFGYEFEGESQGSSFGESQLPVQNAADFSTEERPDLGDFQWYLEDVMYEGIPAAAVNITSLDALGGGWKALIFYDPNDEYGSNAYDFLNITLRGTAENLQLVFDWYLIFWSWEGETYDLTDMEDTVFTGRWEDGRIWASGAGTVHLTDFYTLYNKQFALGTMDTPDGIPALVALTRP